MLGAEAVVDYSLANRSLLFDINSCGWSEKLLRASGLNSEKLPGTAASGTLIGSVSRAAAELTGLPAGTPIAAGAHDQCASSVGAGVLHEGEAFYGLGTFPCITPLYRKWDADAMIELGLNVEHHVVPGLHVSFIYHMGGEIIKWYRELFSDADFEQISEQMGSEPSGLLLMPYMTPMGPPDFISDQSGIFMGLSVDTSREQLLKAIIEANVFALALVVDQLPRAGIPIHTLRTAGGGSRYSSTLQINSDILGIPLIKPNVTEAGALGAGMIGAVGVGVFSSLEEAVAELVRTDMIYEPDSRRSRIYSRYFSYFSEAKEIFSDFNRRMTKDIADGVM
jgi:xylulokinase